MYDAVGKIVQYKPAEHVNGVQNVAYDERDRLISAAGDGWTGGPLSYATTFAYNAIGNLTSKGGLTFAYPTSGSTSVRPHAVTCANWLTSTSPHSCATNETYTYDGNGNLTAGGGRTLTWTPENQPATVTTSSVSQSYLYNADNERVRQTTNSISTFYFGGGMAEETPNNDSWRHVYTFNGHTIAERYGYGTAYSYFNYLHANHLGSIAAVSDSFGGSIGADKKQYFTPWGEARHGNVNGEFGGEYVTKRNFTGQRKDDTGLLFYNARYYDPKLSRFISADSIVPGMASGKGGMGSVGVDGNTKSTLTVDFHEGQFAAGVGDGNTFTREEGFNFELDGAGKYQWGPPNPQALNRYAYVLNNPLRYTDPTGHIDAPGGCDSGSGQGCGGKPPGPTGGGGGKVLRVNPPNRQGHNNLRKPNLLSRTTTVPKHSMLQGKMRVYLVIREPIM